jgi:hypothetical protein
LISDFADRTVLPKSGFCAIFGTSEFDVLRPGFPTMPREKFEQVLRDFDEAEQQSQRSARPRMTMKS